MWTCPKCNERIEDDFDSCWICAGTETDLWPEAHATQARRRARAADEGIEHNLQFEDYPGDELRRARRLGDPVKVASNWMVLWSVLVLLSNLILLFLGAIHSSSAGVQGGQSYIVVCMVFMLSI